MDEVEVVVAHSERATVRVGDVFLKVDADPARLDVEVEAMSLAPVPTPEVLWRKPVVLATAAVRGRTLGRLGGPSTGSPAAWAAAGAAIRTLHDAPLPPRPGRAGRSIAALSAELDAECEALVANGFLPDCSPFSDTWMSELDNTRSKAELGMTYTPPSTYLPDLVAQFRQKAPNPPAGYRRRNAERNLAASLTTES